MADERSGPPAPMARTLDRAALERVLARAAELQASSAEPTDGMSEAQLLELGKEVGISGEHLRQALAEEQTRVAVPEAPGTLAGVFGAGGASAQRVVRGRPANVLAALDSWMQREECLQVRRKYADRVTWEARRDFLGNIKRGFNFGGRGYALTRASEVGATVVAIDDERVLVRLDADFTDSRRRSVGWGATVAGGSVAGAGGLVAVATMMSGAIPVAIAAGAVWMLVGAAGFTGIAQGQRKSVIRGQLALEQILDRLEHNEIRPASSVLDLFSLTTDALKKL